MKRPWWWQFMPGEVGQWLLRRELAREIRRWEAIHARIRALARQMDEGEDRFVELQRALGR